MNELDLFSALSQVDDDILERSEQAPKKRLWLRWAALAAGLILIAAAVITLKPKPNSDDYPFSDREILDYVSGPLENMTVGEDLIILNEITDIEAYRSFNTFRNHKNEPYYSTRTTAYDLLVSSPGDRASQISANVTMKNGEIQQGSPHYGSWLTFRERAPQASELLLRLLPKAESTNTRLAGALVRYDPGLDAAAIYFTPESNVIATAVISRDLTAIDSRFESILPILKGAAPSLINGRQVRVCYFYQTRLFREEKTEEAYQYYVYFEEKGFQYLFQFSSNWSLVGRSVGAMDNPPTTIQNVLSQDQCRRLFAQYLPLLTQP